MLVRFKGVFALEIRSTKSETNSNSQIAEILKKEYPAPFETLIILSLEIVSDFGFRASDFIVALTNIAENLAKNPRFLFIVVREKALPEL